MDRITLKNKPTPSTTTDIEKDRNDALNYQDKKTRKTSSFYHNTTSSTNQPQSETKKSSSLHHITASTNHQQTESEGERENEIFLKRDVESTQPKTKRSIKEIGGAISDRLATQMGSWQDKTNTPGMI